jgi:hypothetical protein
VKADPKAIALAAPTCIERVSIGDVVLTLDNEMWVVDSIDRDTGIIKGQNDTGRRMKGKADQFRSWRMAKPEPAEPPGLAKKVATLPPPPPKKKAAK